MNDPMELTLRGALDRAGIRYTTGDGGGNDKGLDFYLPDAGLHIEVKQFHTPRIAEQMSRAPNVIAVQGRGAVEWLAGIIGAQQHPRPTGRTPDFDSGNGGSNPPEAATS